MGFHNSVRSAKHGTEFHAHITFFERHISFVLAQGWGVEPDPKGFARTRSRIAPSKPEPTLEPSKIFPAPQISYDTGKRTNVAAVFYYTLID